MSSTRESGEPPFLEPPHYHDPTQISNIAAIPTVLLKLLPIDAQKALWDIQESTSVAYASYRRLQDLAKERFHRLVPAKNQDHTFSTIEYSEPAFHNYINFVQAEKMYFLEEAIVDWRHKVLRLDFAGQHNTRLDVDGKHITPLKWWSTLQSEVERWTEEVEEIDIPDFEETVQEYRVFQAKEKRRLSAREERNRRKKTMLNLERPDMGSRTLQKIDSAVIVD